MKQRTLFGIQPTGQGGETVHVPAGRNNPHGQAAAEHMEKSGKAFTQEGQILSYLNANGPAFRTQICGHLDMLESAACGRLNEMVHQGRVRVIGEARGPRGRMVDVYAITPEGRERLGT